MQAKEGQLSNGYIYRKTFVFSGFRFLIELLAVVILVGCVYGGFAISGQSMIGLGIGAVVGLVVFYLLVHFFTYLLKAGQIAMMMKGVTENALPDNVMEEGKKEVKSRFVTVIAYYTVTRLIQGIFAEITRGINALGQGGGQAGEGVAGTISAIINVIVAYLGDCCLGWVFYKKDQNAFKSTCEGAVLFFKNWKALIKNLGRIFGFGVLSFVVIGGAFTAIGYVILGQFPSFISAIGQALHEMNADIDATDPTVTLIILALVFAIIIWAILHNVFVRPFILVGVLRNYMNAGISNPPKESSFAQLDGMSKKFAKAHQKAMS